MVIPSCVFKRMQVQNMTYASNKNIRHHPLSIIAATITIPRTSFERFYYDFSKIICSIFNINLTYLYADQCILLYWPTDVTIILFTLP